MVVDHDETQGQAQGQPDDEQAAALASLQRGAREQESARAAEVTAEEDEEAAAQVAQVQSLADQNTQGLAMLMDLAVPTLGTFGFPTVARVLASPAPSGMTAGHTLAAAWGPVLAKYGISMGMLGDRYGAEISAVMVTLPIAGAVLKAVKADTVGKREKAAQAQQVAASAPEEPPAEIILGSPAEATP